MSEVQEPETNEAPPVAASDASENGPDRERVAAPAAPVNPCLAAALRYASIGIPVLPLWWPRTDGTCACGKPQDHAEGKGIGKHPIGALARHGKDDATTDQETITRWFTQYPEANVGLRMGGGAALVALDIDPRNG